MALTSVLAIVAGFALASLLFTVLLITGLVVGGWLWWRLRGWARQARAAAPVIIEGEYRIVAEHPALTESRGRIAAGEPVGHLVPPEVAAALVEEGLVPSPDRR